VARIGKPGDGSSASFARVDGVEHRQRVGLAVGDPDFAPVGGERDPFGAGAGGDVDALPAALEIDRRDRSRADVGDESAGAVGRRDHHVRDLLIGGHRPQESTRLDVHFEQRAVRLGGDQGAAAVEPDDAVRSAVVAEVDRARDARGGDVDQGERRARLAAAVVGDQRVTPVGRDADLVRTLTGGQRRGHLPGFEVDQRQHRLRLVGDGEGGGGEGAGRERDRQRQEAESSHGAIFSDRPAPGRLPARRHEESRRPR
jgi:hypothetical protein